MKLIDLKSSYQSQNTQFVTFNKNGTIIESDDVLFSISSGIGIFEVHPFFESIIGSSVINDNLSFSCVHLNIENDVFICDIDIKKIDSNLYLLTITDFSKHYESFQSLAQSRNETAIQSELLELSHELLKEKETFKNKFIANFSHEIKSPITSMIAFTNLLKKSKLSGEQKEYLDVISSSSYHLKSMINDILDISKIETGKLEINIERFNFNQLIEQIDSEYQLKCTNRRLGFKLIVDKTIPEYIESDKTRIRQIIKNLLDNAIKFTPSGSVSLEIKNSYKRAQNITLSFIVTDTGIGIKKEDHDKIFKSFNRLKSAENIDGVGLGLTIVKEIIELMNGSLHIESSINKGSTFTATVKAKFPLIQKYDKPKVEKKSSYKQKKVKHQILLVEDNDIDQLTIFKILAKSNYFFLDIVSNGFEAVEAVKKTHYDAILVDYRMPLINGVETAKAIRGLSDKKKNNVPIILVTGKLITDELLAKKGPVFSDIIEKPFEEETLINTIQNCLK